LALALDCVGDEVPDVDLQGYCQNDEGTECIFYAFNNWHKNNEFKDANLAQKRWQIRGGNYV
jgi:hypothetical protein